MVQMKVDATGVDPTKSSGFEPYEGPVPKPGVYAAVIQSVRIRISQAGNPYFNVLYVLDNQETAEKQACKGAPVFDKVVPGESDIQKERLGKFIHTVCNKVKANVDHDEVTDGGKVNKIGGKDPVGTKVRLVVAREMYNGEAQAKVTDVFQWPKDKDWPTGEFEDEELEESEDDETEDDDTEEEPEEDDDEVEDDEEDDDEEEEDDEEDEEDEDGFEERSAELEGLDRAALKNIAKSDYDLKVLKKHTEEDLRNMILDHEFPAEGEEDDDEEDGDDKPPF